MRRLLHGLCLLAVTLPAAIACDDAGDTSTASGQRRCDVLFLLQQRVGSRIASPAPAALDFASYAIVDGERVQSPSQSACVTHVADQLDDACGACIDDPGGCEQLVRTIFAVPDASCSACGDGACLTGETAQSCPEDCASSCGDETCAADENAIQCPFDCAVACGDSFCASGESPETCPQDCKYTVGDGLCEPGEGPVNSPQDCQNATCGDGYCQSYETSLLCPEDCCTNSICAADGLVCTGTHELASCRVAGLGNCPEVYDPQPCELGCEWRPGDEAAGCRTCASVATDLGYTIGAGPQVGDRVAASCTRGDGVCLATEAALELTEGDTSVPPVWLEHRVVDCEPLVAFDTCSLATTQAACARDEGCDDGGCVSCEQVARASGLYPDLDVADYAYGCVPGDAVCARVGWDGNAAGLRDVVVDCEVIPGSSCTIGRVLEDCGFYEPGPQSPSCLDGVCGNCAAAARADGFELETEAVVFGCDRSATAPSCFTGRSSLHRGEDHAFVIDTCESPGGTCTAARVLEDCGTADDGARICADGGCVDCEALARADSTYDFDNVDYVFGCDAGQTQCVGDLVVNCGTLAAQPACTIGEVVRDCAADGPTWHCTGIGTCTETMP